MHARNRLGCDEDLVVVLRAHPKALVWPALLLIADAAGVGAGLALVPESYQPYGLWLVGAVGLLIAVLWVIRPALRWLTTTYTLTTRRVMIQRGVLFRQGHDLPLNRVNDVAYRSGPVDRILGCGTVVLTTASEQPMVLADVPQVKKVYEAFNRLLYASQPQRDQPS